jgi:DNA-binding NarL/FixJ family response regulator
MPPPSSPPPPPKKRVLLVDDHPVFRAGLAGLVNMEPDLAVCGEASNATEALDLTTATTPDLVLLDMSLPGKSGLELLKDLRAAHPSLPVLIVSMHDETLYAERIIRAGGRGYLMKQEGPEKMLQAIRKVLAGGMAVSERMAGIILDAIAARQASQTFPPNGIGSVSTLTDREFEIYRLIGQGKEPQEVARLLHLSIKTVDTHRAHIKRKLGLKNYTELVHHATRWASDQL